VATGLAQLVRRDADLLGRRTVLGDVERAALRLVGRGRLVALVEAPDERVERVQRLGQRLRHRAAGLDRATRVLQDLRERLARLLEVLHEALALRRELARDLRQRGLALGREALGQTLGRGGHRLRRARHTVEARQRREHVGRVQRALREQLHAHVEQLGQALEVVEDALHELARALHLAHGRLQTLERIHAHQAGDLLEDRAHGPAALLGLAELAEARQLRQLEVDDLRIALQPLDDDAVHLLHLLRRQRLACQRPDGAVQRLQRVQHGLVGLAPLRAPALLVHVAQEADGDDRVEQTDVGVLSGGEVPEQARVLQAPLQGLLVRLGRPGARRELGGCHQRSPLRSGRRSAAARRGRCSGRAPAPSRGSRPRRPTRAPRPSCAAAHSR
jgi:hypothetical protein